MSKVSNSVSSRGAPPCPKYFNRKHPECVLTIGLGIDIGDFVEADEVVARIETDKVTVDILSDHSGVITKLFAEEGDTVEVGA